MSLPFVLLLFVFVCSNAFLRQTALRLPPPSATAVLAAKQEQDLRILSWNVDGLGEEATKRAKKIVSTILSLSPLPHVVCLQEITEETHGLFEQGLRGSYACHSQLSQEVYENGYFTTMYCLNEAIKTHAVRRIAFSCGSNMGRDVLSIDVALVNSSKGNNNNSNNNNNDNNDDHSFPATIMTTHLESLKQNRYLRTAQFRELHALMTREAKKNRRPVVLCGDLNIRDEEVAEVDPSLLLEDAYLKYVDVSRSKQGEQQQNPQHKREEIAESSKTWRRWESNKKFWLSSRFDRCFSNRAGIVLDTSRRDGKAGYRLIGDVKMEGQDKERVGYEYLSDHLALLVDYKLVGHSTPSTAAPSSSASISATSDSSLPSSFPPSSSSPSLASSTELLPLSLRELNDAQQLAVHSPLGYVRVRAGPGSGKTRVLVSRVAHMLSDMQIPPSQVLALTFTRKAAKEMKHRLSGLLEEEEMKKLTVCTLHSFCALVLRRYAFDNSDYEENIASGGGGGGEGGRGGGGGGRGEKRGERGGGKKEGGGFFSL